MPDVNNSGRLWNYEIRPEKFAMGLLRSCAWTKTFELTDRTFSEWEMAWTSFDSVARWINMKPFQRNGTRINPCQKPVQLYKWLLKNYAKPGDTIFDSHMGSQSSRIACYEGGFDFVGCELDKDYFDAGNKRFENYKLQLKLQF